MIKKNAQTLCLPELRSALVNHFINYKNFNQNKLENNNRWKDKSEKRACGRLQVQGVAQLRDNQ